MLILRIYISFNKYQINLIYNLLKKIKPDSNNEFEYDSLDEYVIYVS